MAEVPRLRTSPVGVDLGRLDGVSLSEPMRTFIDERGWVARVLRLDDPAYACGPIREAYLSACRHKAVKGWHVHRRMVLRYCCVVGEALVVLYDDRPTSLTAGFSFAVRLAAPPAHRLLSIPPGVWNAYRVPPDSGAAVAVILNLATEVHDPAEIERLPVGGEGSPPWLPEWGAFDARMAF